MCGILFSVAKQPGGIIEPNLFERMLTTLEKRGPDHGEVFERDGIQLGHRRLSIIDLAGGTQPVFNEDHSIACILNGEIYNYRELRARLERAGHRFRTHSDTEVLVHAYEEHGEKFLDSVVGMFAFAIADFSRRRLIVARDRVGEKPLFVHETDERTVFASELKALLPLAGKAARIDRDALASYLRFGWIPGERTIYSNIRRVPPATLLIVEGGRTTERRYWNPDLSPLPSTSRTQIVEIVRNAMQAAMSNKLVADVPVGVLLSGGLDSSAVVAMCSSVSTAPLRTFSVGFGSATNELPYARQVAARYQTQHVELTIDANLSDAVSEIAAYFDEPFADSSSVPTFLICREARKHVKVILSGDGGDELLGGYGSYLPMRSYSDIRGVRGIARRLDEAGSLGARLVEHAYPLPGNRGARAYWENQRATFSAVEVHQLARSCDSFRSDARLQLPGHDPLSRAFEFDLNWYLPDDLLKKVDMASMANSLECRAPLLDHQLLETCMRLPPMEKVRGRDTKTVMREALKPMLPSELIWREKQGFGAPLVEWLTGPLSELAHDSLNARARVRDLLEEKSLDRTLEDSWRSLRSDWRAPLKLWSLLSLELWLSRQSDAP